MVYVSNMKVPKIVLMTGSIVWYVTYNTTEVEGKHHGNGSLSKQEVSVWDGSHLHYAKNWIHTSSASGSYGRPASKSSDENLKIIGSYNLTSNVFWIFIFGTQL